MKSKSNLQTISELAASQSGLFTSAQAQRFGVSRNVLSYMVATGKIERLEHGVYKAAGVPNTAFQGILAAWMSTDPKSMIYERRYNWDGIVVGGRSAAAVMDIGDFFLSPYHFFTPERYNTRRDNMIFIKRQIAPADIFYTNEGMPVTSIARTIFDLRKDNEDPSMLSAIILQSLELQRAYITSETPNRMSLQSDFRNMNHSDAKQLFDYYRLKELFDEDSTSRGGMPEGAFGKMFIDAGLLVIQQESCNDDNDLVFEIASPRESLRQRFNEYPIVVRTSNADTLVKKPYNYSKG